MRTLLAATSLLVLGTVAVQAADLVVSEPAVVVSDAEPGLYVQFLGGAALGTDYTFYNAGVGSDNATDLGWALGGTVGIVVTDGLSVELDTLYTHRNLSDFDDSDMASLSLMGNLKYSFALDDTFSVYGAAGLGYIKYFNTFEGADGEFSGFGYQLIAGVGADVADGVTLLGELRYQNTFGNAGYDTDASDYEVSVPTTAVLGGVKFGF